MLLEAAIAVPTSFSRLIHQFIEAAGHVLPPLFFFQEIFMSDEFPYHRFSSPLHQAWKRDRAIRQQLPVYETWRGCVGIAALWKNVDDCEIVGERVLYPSAGISWLCLRDIPTGQFPGSRVMHRRNVCYASMATANLRHGMPHLNFAAPTRQSWDFTRMPYGSIRFQRSNGRSELHTACGDTLNCDERPREFGVLNAISLAMTEFAFFTKADSGRWIRPAWAAQRPEGRTMCVTSPASWFPRAYLGYHADQVLRLRTTRSWPTISLHLLELRRWPEIQFIPVKVASSVPRSMQPIELIWDFAQSEPFINSGSEAAIYPPVQLRHWHRLRFNILQADVNAGIGDPRFTLATRATPFKAADNRPDSFNAIRPILAAAS